MVTQTPQPTLLAGTPLRDALLTQISTALPTLTTTPKLVVIQVGKRPESTLYVQFKQKAAAEVGITCTIVQLPEAISRTDLETHITDLNQDADVTGILLQLPLPDHLHAATNAILAAINPLKDVDGLTPHNQGLLATGNTTDGLLPATPLGVMRLLRHYAIEPAGQTACMVGASNLVGAPLARLLTLADATVSVCHSQTGNLAQHTQTADIVLSATGVAELIEPAMIKNGAVLVDIGISREHKRIIGDIDPTCHAKASAYTPVPGGVGPMTVGSLLTNVVDAVRLQSGQAKMNWRI